MIKRLICIFIVLCMFAGHRTSNIFMNDMAIDAGLNHPRVVQFDESIDDLVDLSEVFYDHVGEYSG